MININFCVKCGSTLSVSLIKISDFEEDLELVCNDCNITFYYDYLDHLFWMWHNGYRLYPNMNLHYSNSFIINIDNFSSKENKVIEQYMYDCFAKYYENRVFV